MINEQSSSQYNDDCCSCPTPGVAARRAHATAWIPLLFCIWICVSIRMLAFALKCLFFTRTPTRLAPSRFSSHLSVFICWFILRAAEHNHLHSFGEMSDAQDPHDFECSAQLSLSISNNRKLKTRPPSHTSRTTARWKERTTECKITPKNKQDEIRKNKIHILNYDIHEWTGFRFVSHVNE